MKELSIEEKAKRYDEAITKARNIVNSINVGLIGKDSFEAVFPELKENEESEGEKIREKLIDTFNFYGPAMNSPYLLGINRNDIVAWLEKQGEQKLVPDWMPKFLDELRSKKNYFDWCEHKDIEGGILAIIKWLNPNYFNGKDGEQKPADKVEPKFKVGDWLVHNERRNIIKVVNATPLVYEVVDVLGYHHTITDTAIENNYHLWTTKDAKTGDVLSDGTTIFIFEDLLSDGSVMSYCDYDTDSGESDAFCPLLMNLMCSKITPTTKEQHDTLMKAMTDAGYEWNAEKNELKKIEDEEYNGKDYGIDSLFHAQRILEKTLGSVEGYQSDDGILEHKCAISAVKKLYEQKPASITDELIEDY